MGFWIGIDEAGYGPNLGPLVISASVWDAPDDVGADDLNRIVGDAIATADSPEAGSPKVVLADSKTIYRPGKGISLLERGVLAALAILRREPRTWRAAWDALAPDSQSARDATPWCAGCEAAVPLETDVGAIQPVAELMRRRLAEAGIRLVGLRSRAVFETEFNQLLDAHGSKGALLSQVSLALAAALLQAIPAGLITVVCDKHGGRNRYRDLLMQWFPHACVEVLAEGREESVYRFRSPPQEVEFRFRAKGETCFAVALASMASKYLRELAMQALNAYWRSRVPGLEPTAGYPRDAARFKKAIAPFQHALGIDDRMLWRFK